MDSNSKSISSFSVSAAWEQTKALLARDGRLFASVALALIVLPAVVAGVIDPRAGGEVDAPTWFDLVFLLVTLISMAGQLALIRLALGPSVTVAGAMSHGLGRLFPYIVSLVILGLGVIILSIPFGMAAIAMGLSVEGGTIKSVSGPIALVQPKALYQFADPELEKLSAGQKIMIRMGPANAAKVKAKLRQIRSELAKAEVKP